MARTFKTNYNLVLGTIIHKETQLPLPRLVVEVYDLDPFSEDPDSKDKQSIFVNPDPNSILNDPATFKKVNHAKFPNGIPGDRLGSAITDENGEFRLEYDDNAFKIRRKNAERTSGQVDIRPDLFIIVQVAEKSGLKEFENVIYRSNWARINAGRKEHYFIEINSETLKEFAYPIPEATLENTTSKISDFKNRLLQQRELRLGISKVREEVDELDKEEKEKVRENIKKVINPLIENLTSLPNYVSGDKGISEVQTTVIKSGASNIEDEINDGFDISNMTSHPEPGKGININLILSNSEKSDLDTFKFTVDGKDYYDLPESEIEKILFKKEDDEGVNAILFNNNPISKYCQQKSVAEKCAMVTLDPPSDDSDSDDTDAADATDTTVAAETTTIAEPAPIDEEDLPVYLNNILLSKGADLFSFDENLGKRPDAGSVQANVDSFSLQKGPAETTAFYDFHTMHIAFDYVWKQLLDKTLINLGEQAHTQLQSSGRSSFFNKDLQLNEFYDEVYTSLNIPEEVPTLISKIFDISFLEYSSMSEDYQKELYYIAEEIDETEPFVKTASSSINSEGETSFTENLTDNRLKLKHLREKGEMLIDNVRINEPNSTNAILKELHERLNSKYEFTVFAADNKHKSVNFGILNTFRQKWEPISYQAGKLVKTIPMAPKEERKYSVKVSRKVNTVEKQAQKFNSNLSSEYNVTSRVESEIMLKAQKKSDFDFNVEANYSRVSSKLGIGKDATKDSSESKKDFREAVLKSAQEYKEERSVQIDTEDTFESEYNESGTLVNPNEELSVTYLFYELQRRYRVSEQLYRVMPVVLIAQEVPAPNEITIAWVIANDWIINRVLLDDSFRPILQFIGQGQIGDDFAIRELRKSLRQQRTLVSGLELEFSKLQRDLKNKYNFLRESTSERIEEEHDKRTYKKYLWGLFGANQDEKPDPEMAKAIEQAAEDDYAHTVEQAKQLSMSLEREVNALHKLTKEYNDAMEAHLDRISASKRLVTHIKENILYYMQAIWRMEPPDQRFMRLHNVQVPDFSVERRCVVADESSADIFSEFRNRDSEGALLDDTDPEWKGKYQAWLFGKVKPKLNAGGDEFISQKDLVEVADLDNLLGFKGNYMIFPLKEHNDLTKLMAAPYVDEAFGAMDPDQLSNINLEEYSKYICCLMKEDPDEYERLKPVLKKWLEQLLSDPLRNGDELIVPTNSLFIEMLPSDKSLLEDFKLKHRKMDVMKVQAEVRQMEIDNIRKAARILDSNYEDPDIDKKIMIEGDSANTNIDIDSD